MTNKSVFDPFSKNHENKYEFWFSYINPYFLAPSPLKPLKSSPRYQNLPGEPLTAHSDHKGPFPDPKTANIDQTKETNLTYVDFCFLYEAILGPLKAGFDKLDR